jgi:hypothetical protein
MPNQLRDISIDEISLVDAPANALTDPATGRKVPLSTVALYKRDSTADPLKEGKMELTLKQIRKSDNLTFSRESIATAIRNKAAKIAAKKGISIEKAEARVWRKHPEAHRAYENAATPVAKAAERRAAMVTEAEGELDSRARKRMKRTGESYAKACQHELEQDPSLYEKYEKESVNGATFAVPEPPEYSGSNFVNGNGDDDDDAVDDNSMYARRGQSTSNNDMTDQERKRGKMRR